MNKQLLLLGVFFHCYLALGTAQGPALFYRAGTEIGGSISSFVPKTQKENIYHQRLGGRLGLYAMHRIHGHLDLRTGLLYTLRGLTFNDQINPYSSYGLWNIHSISAPVMLFYHLSPQVNVAFGIEFNTVIESNIPIYHDGFDWGLRGACGFYVNPRCRIAAYYTQGLDRFWLRNANFNGTDAYYNVLAGISVSYEFHQLHDYPNAPTFQHPCPRF